MKALKQLEGLESSPRPKERVDFVSRFFAPKTGLEEDPVTSLSYCILIFYQNRILGKDNLITFQLSERGRKLFHTYIDEKV